MGKGQNFSPWTSLSTEVACLSVASAQEVIKGNRDEQKLACSSPRAYCTCYEGYFSAEGQRTEQVDIFITILWRTEGQVSTFNFIYTARIPRSRSSEASLKLALKLLTKARKCDYIPHKPCFTLFICCK